MGAKKVLIAVASRHGATIELARAIRQVLVAAGAQVELWSLTPETAALPVAGFDAICLGSAVYGDHWLPAAVTLARRVGELDPKPQVWAFSSGAVGVHAWSGGPSDPDSLVALCGAVEHKAFSGALLEDELATSELAELARAQIPLGDYRNWAAVRAWAQTIALNLSSAAAPVN
jgi:menaquinone-dependent protoporphyrinogen oxidase